MSMRWSPRKQHNFVCTRCRRSVRRHANSLMRGGGEVRCATCGDLCEDVGAKLPVPKRSDLKAWKQLQDDLGPPRAERIAELEGQLASLDNAPSSPTIAAYQRADPAAAAARRAELEHQLKMLRKLHTNRTGPQPSPAYRPPTRRGADRAARATAATQGADDA